MKKMLFTLLLVVASGMQAGPCDYSNPHVLVENNYTTTDKATIAFECYRYTVDTSNPPSCSDSYDGCNLCPYGAQPIVYGDLRDKNSSRKWYFTQGTYTKVTGATAWDENGVLLDTWTGEIWTNYCDCASSGGKHTAVKVKLKDNGTLEVLQR